MIILDILRISRHCAVLGFLLGCLIIVVHGRFYFRCCSSSVGGEIENERFQRWLREVFLVASIIYTVFLRRTAVKSLRYRIGVARLEWLWPGNQRM